MMEPINLRSGRAKVFEILGNTSSSKEKAQALYAFNKEIIGKNVQEKIRKAIFHPDFYQHGNQEKILSDVTEDICKNADASFDENLFPEKKETAFFDLDYFIEIQKERLELGEFDEFQVINALNKTPESVHQTTEYKNFAKKMWESILKKEKENLQKSFSDWEEIDMTALSNEFSASVQKTEACKNFAKEMWEFVLEKELEKLKKLDSIDQFYVENILYRFPKSVLETAAYKKLEAAMWEIITKKEKALLQSYRAFDEIDINTVLREFPGSVRKTEPYKNFEKEMWELLKTNQ